MDTLQQLVSGLATICTIALFLTGIPTCRKILRKGNTSDTSSFPFLVMFSGCTLWLKYGLMKGDQTLILVNGVGSAVNLIFVGIYYTYTVQKALLHKQMLFACLLLFPILCYIKYWAANLDLALAKLGLFCAVIGVLSYGAPLSAVREVVRRKSTECMAFPLSLANFVCAVLWVSYGNIIGDLFVKVPNVCGIILGAVQLSLFAVYRGPSTQVDIDL